MLRHIFASLVVCLLLCVPAFHGEAANGWKAGENYTVLAAPAPTHVGAGKVEVVEFFDYGCPHCNRFEPFIVDWSKRKPDYIVFVRVPGVWSEWDRPYARLFYTLQAVNRLDLHQAVFDAIHRAKQPLIAKNPKAENENFKLQLAFARVHGIDTDEFTRAYRSAAVGRAVDHAAQFVRQCQVTAVPTMVVNGKYVSDMDKVGGAGSQRTLLNLVNDLAAEEESGVRPAGDATNGRPQ